MRHTVAEYPHRTYQQHLPSSFHYEPDFGQGFYVSPDLKRASSTVPERTGCPTNEYDNGKRVPATKVLVASLPPSTEGTMSLDEGLIDLVPSVPLASSSTGPNTLVISFP